MPYIFVYGTLRKELHNNWLLDKDTYICKTTTTNLFYMVATKSKAYPFISNTPILYVSPAPCKIVGELYDVSPSTLKILDSLEGHPHTYTRHSIDVDGCLEVVDASILTSDDVRDGIRNSGRYVPIVTGDFALFVLSNTHTNSPHPQ